MKGKIVYRFATPAYPGNIVYLNLIANYSCSNDCLFCSRPRDFKNHKLNIYEKKAGTCLFLPNPPALDEVIKALDETIKPSDEEIAIVGLGEPTLNFELLKQVLVAIKERCDLKVRLDTNGLVRCTHKDACKTLNQLHLDEIRISLNAINEEEYNKLCRPKFNHAFQELVEFVKECVNSNIDTYVSFVAGFKESKSKEEYISFAKGLGVKEENVILRNYIEPI